MRRTVTLIALVLLTVAALPATLALAAGPPAEIKLTPTVDTKELGQTYTATALVEDASDVPVSGVNVDMRVTAGGHADNDLDSNAATPNGYIGECTTGAGGACARSFVGSEETTDTVTAFVDTNDNDALDGGELSATATVTWKAVGAGTKRVRLDMEGCNGDGSAPIDETTWNATSSAGPVGSPKEICAARFSSADAASPGPVVFTILSGPGYFTDATGTKNLGSTVVSDVLGGYNHAYLLSTVTGITEVRATAEGQNATGYRPWTAAAARTVTVDAPATAVPGSTQDVTATVRDLYGNAASGVLVTFTETGVGRFTNGTSSTAATTGPSGQASAGVSTTSGETGTQTITATIDPAATDCERLAQDPAGAPAGDCDASDSIVWGSSATTITVSVFPAIAVWGTNFQIRGQLTSSDQPVAGRFVTVEKRPAGIQDWSAVNTAVTDQAGRYSVIDRPDVNSDYRARFSGDPAYIGSLSGQARGNVRVGVILNVSPSSLFRGRATTFTGRVLPEHPGHIVYLQQLTGTGWRSIASTRTNTSSNYTFRVVKASPGWLLFRTAAPSDFDHAWNLSTNRRVDWT